MGRLAAIFPSLYIVKMSGWIFSVYSVLTCIHVYVFTKLYYVGFLWLLKVIFNLKGTFDKTTKKNERNSAEASDNEHTKSADHLQIPLLSPKCIILYTVQHFSSELEAFHWAWIFLNDIFRYLDVCYYFHSGICGRAQK